MLEERQVLFQDPVKTAPDSLSFGSPGGCHCLMFSENGEQRTLFSLGYEQANFGLMPLRMSLGI